MEIVSVARTLLDSPNASANDAVQGEENVA